MTRKAKPLTGGQPAKGVGRRKRGSKVPQPVYVVKRCESDPARAFKLYVDHFGDRYLYPLEVRP